MIKKKPLCSLSDRKGTILTPWYHPDSRTKGISGMSLCRHSFARNVRVSVAAYSHSRLLSEKLS